MMKKSIDRLVIIVSIGILVGTIMGMITILTNVNNFEKQVGGQNEKLATHISKTSEYFVKNQRFDYFETMLNELTEINYLKEVVLYINGQKRVAIGHLGNGRYKGLPEKSAELDHYYTDKRSKIQIINKPISVDHTRNRMLSMAFSLEAFQKPKDNIMFSFKLIGLLMVVLMSVVTWFIITRQKLASAEQTRSDMIYSMTHDAKQDLMIIQGKAFTALKKCKRGDAVELIEKDLKNVQRSAETIDRFLENLKDQERLQRGETKVIPSDVDMMALIEGTIAGYEVDIQNKKINCRFVNQAYNQKIETDEQLVKRIMNNLLHNAIKFSPEGSVVDIELNENNDDLVITIKDQGPGIEKSNWEKIFKPHVKLATRGSGLGLGLSNARMLVQLMQGELKIVESIKNRGTIFYVRLPRSLKA